MVCTFYPPFHFGGDAIFVQGLARGLHKRGHHVEVVHCADAYSLKASRDSKPARVVHDGVVVHRLESPFGALSPILTQITGFPVLKHSALKEILARGFDVVNFHNTSLIGGPGILPLSKAPVNLYTIHDHWLFCASHILWKNQTRVCDSRQCIQCSLRSGIPPQVWRYTGLVQRCVRSVDAFLSPSAYTAAKHTEAGLDLPIRVLPTYASVPPGDRAPFTTPVRPRFVFAGRMTASKGIDALVRQFAQLPQYDLDVAGEGELLPSLQSAYAGRPWIRFHGGLPHDELFLLVRQATALLLPSIAPEVFPLVTLEAFALGTPVIVAAVGGAPEAVERNGAGFVYHNEDELRQALDSLASRPELREELSRKAQHVHNSYYNEDRYMDEYLGIIETIQAGKKPQARAAGMG